MEDIKKIKAPCIKNSTTGGIGKLQAVLDNLEKNSLEFHLWDDGGEYKPEASFSIAHVDHSILLKFFVIEKEIRAEVSQTNGPVCEDSCVEFFVSFDQSGYYNFEFNAIGTILAAFGKNKSERTFLPEEMLQRIEVFTKVSTEQASPYWEMFVVIPIELFIYHSLPSLSGVVCGGNFYKCGDRLSQPHFLSWSNIETGQPNFHLPEFFGTIVFESN
jgi:hypothetical protein